MEWTADLERGAEFTDPNGFINPTEERDPKPTVILEVALPLPAALRGSEIGGARFVWYKTDGGFAGGRWLELAFPDMPDGSPDWSNVVYSEEVFHLREARELLATLELDDVL